LLKESNRNRNLIEIVKIVFLQEIILLSELFFHLHRTTKVRDRQPESEHPIKKRVHKEQDDYLFEEVGIHNVLKESARERLGLSELLAKLLDLLFFEILLVDDILDGQFGQPLLGLLPFLFSLQE
jgi:hypothetical protein